LSIERQVQSRIKGVKLEFGNRKSHIKGGNTMDGEQLRHRTKTFALRIIKLVGSLPKTIEGREIGRQLIRSGTSIGANYRGACKGRSMAEFIAKLGIVEEEADETAYWLELVIEGGLLEKRVVDPLLREANELVAIMASSRKTASRRK
jgi:four helix bundle protein